MNQHRTAGGRLTDLKAVGEVPVARQHVERAAAIRALTAGRDVIYAIRRSDGVVKIGWTSDLTARRRRFGTDTRLLAIAFGEYDDEQAIHRRLRVHRAEGREFYHPTPEVLAVVNELRAQLGQESLATL